MQTVEEVRTISLKMPKDLVEETEALAKASAKSLPEYIREAVREKNERQIADRIKFLVGKFATEAEVMNKEFDATIGENLGND